MRRGTNLFLNIYRTRFIYVIFYFLRVIRSKQIKLIINIYKTRKANEPVKSYKPNESLIGRINIEKTISRYNSNKIISFPNMKKIRTNIFYVINDFDKMPFTKKCTCFSKTVSHQRWIKY